MDDMFDSLSKKGRKLKGRLGGKKHKPDGTVANIPGESASSSGSFPRPEPHVVAGGRDEERNRTSTDVRQERSRDRSPQPGPMLAGGDGGVMSTVSQGASGSTAYTGLRPPLGQLAVVGNRPAQVPPEESISREIKRLTGSVEKLRIQHEESSVKKDLDALVKSLDRLGLGANGGDADHRLQPAQSSALLITLEQFTEKLQEASDRIKNAGYTGSDEDAKVVSQLMKNIDEIRAAIVDCQFPALPPNPTGESPPPAPKACFGRDDLIDEVVTLAESLTSVALIGTGGIGKTSIALTVLHHDRIKQRFGENRRFLRCDQFPATLGHLLNRLSEVTGAGIKNPNDLTSLRPFMSSKEMMIVLDNAESILDPGRTDAGEIYSLVEELSELPTLCLCITSRISTIPKCETFEVPVLSMDAARSAFYQVYKYDKGSGLVNDILAQLEFHPLSITLLATVGHQNKWRMDRLKGEWKKGRTKVLQTRHKKSLAAAIELSLASPTFQELGPDARELLEVVAFFPQGVDENNIDWLFPTISNRINILDGFCVLSLTSRSNGFITMLAPLRDYLSPNDPKLSPLLCAVKELYFIRMSVSINPNKPDFKETQWIISEDVNVEHLLDIFTTVDADSNDVWNACAKFMTHLGWHKPRLTLLAPKIEGLPDSHRYKSEYLAALAALPASTGNHVECKRLLSHALKLEREQGDDVGVADILWELCDANRHMGLCDEGVQQARECLAIHGRLGNAVGQADCLIQLASLFERQGQLDAAEESASRAIHLLPETGEEFRVCESHEFLGNIYRSKGEIDKAVYHLATALRIAFSFDWHSQLTEIHITLAMLFGDVGWLDNAQDHAEQAKLYAVNDPYSLGKATMLQAGVWQRQDKLEEARSEALRAAEIFEKLRASEDVETCKKLVQELDRRITSNKLRIEWKG